MIDLKTGKQIVFVVLVSFLLNVISTHPALDSIANRNIMFRQTVMNGDKQSAYYLASTADAPLKAVVLDPTNTYCFRTTPVGQSLYMLFYGDKGQGTRRLIMQNASSDQRKLTLATGLINGDDIDAFHVFQPKSIDPKIQGKYVIVRGNFILGTDNNGLLIMGDANSYAANPTPFLFEVVLADDVIASLAGQEQAYLDMLNASFNQQIADAYAATISAGNEQIDLAVENATSEQINAQKAQLARMDQMKADLENEIVKVNAENQALKDKLAEMKKLQAVEADKFNLAIAQLEGNLSTMSPEEQELARQRIVIMRSSKEDMVRRLDEDAKVIAASKAHNISLSIEIAALVQKRADAEAAIGQKIKLALMQAELAQTARTDALRESFRTQQQEILKQTALLTAELDKINTENAAMAKTLKELQDMQQAQQDEKNKKIAELQGIVYSIDTFTAAELNSALDRLLVTQSLSTEAAAEMRQKISTLSKNGKLALATDGIVNIQRDKQALVAKLQQQMQKISAQKAEIAQKQTQILVLNAGANNMEKAKSDVQNALLDALNNAEKQIADIDANSQTFADKMNTAVADLAKTVTASSSEAARENVIAQTRAFRQQISANKTTAMNNIQTIVSQTNAKFMTLTALFVKAANDLNDEQQILVDNTNKLLDNLTKGTGTDADIAKARADYQTQIDAIATRRANIVSQSGDIAAKKNAFNTKQQARLQAWNDAKNKAYAAEIEALQKTAATQSATLQAEGTDRIKALQQQHAAEQDQIKTAEEESMQQLNASLEAQKQMQLAVNKSIEAQIATEQTMGHAAVEKLEGQLKNVTADTQQARDAKLAELQTAITQAATVNFNLITKLQNEKIATEAAMQQKLDERKKMLQDYADELQARKDWAVNASKQELDLLQNLYQQASAEQKQTYAAAMNDSKNSFQATLANLNAAKNDALNALQAQIQDAENAAAQEQAKLTQLLKNQQTNYDQLLQQKQVELTNLQGEQRVAAQKALDDLIAANQASISLLSTSLQAKVEQQQKALEDLKALGALKVAMLQQELVELTQLKSSVRLIDKDEILIQIAEDNCFLTHKDNASIIFEEGVRFMPQYRFKVVKEKGSLFSLRTPDEQQALTLQTDGSVKMENLVATAGADKTGNAANTFATTSTAQLFAIEGEFTKAYIKTADKTKILAPNSAKNGISLIDMPSDAAKEIPGFVWIKRMASGSGTFESVLANLFTTQTKESSEQALAMAYIYFMSNRIFNQPAAMQDFTFALSEFVDSKNDAKLFSESAADKLKVLMDKMDGFILSAKNVNSDTRGKTAIEQEVLDSLAKAKQFLDPITLADGSIISIHEDDFFVISQTISFPSARNFVRVARAKPYDPDVALKVTAGTTAGTYALSSLDGRRWLTRSANGLEFMPLQETAGQPIATTQLFNISGTRLNAQITYANNILVLNTQNADLAIMFLIENTTSSSSNTAGYSRSLKIDIAQPGSIEYDFFTKGKSEFTNDAASREAMTAIVNAVKSRLDNPKLASAQKVDALQKFQKYLEVYSNTVDANVFMEWTRQTNDLVDYAQRQMPNADHKLFEDLLNTVKAFTLKNNTYLKIQNKLQSDVAAQGSNSCLTLSDDNANVISRATANLSIKNLFKVVAIDSNTCGLVASNGKYLEATNQGIVVSNAAAVQDNGTINNPTDAQKFNFIGSGNIVMIQVASMQNNGDTGFVIVDSNGVFTHKNAETLDDPFFNSSNVRAKFSIEIFEPDSLKYEIITGDFNRVPALWFEALAKIADSDASASEKNAQASDLLNEFVDMITETAGQNTTIKDSMKNLQQIKSDEAANIYTMGQAIDFLNRYVLFDANFRKNGIVFNEKAMAKLAVLQRLFTADTAPVDAPATSTRDVGDDVNYIFHPNPNDPKQDEGDYLNSLFTDKTDNALAGSILHAYLTNVLHILYGSSFIDNINQVNMDDSGRIIDGNSTFTLQRTEQTVVDAGNTLYTTQLLDQDKKPYTKQIQTVIAAQTDENGNVTDAEQTVQDNLKFGLNLCFDAEKRPAFMLPNSQNLLISSSLDEGQLKLISRNLLEFAESINPIIRNFPLAKDFIKSLANAIVAQKIDASKRKPTIAEQTDIVLKNAMHQLLLEEYDAVDKILTTIFQNYPKSGAGVFDLAKRNAVNTQSWEEGSPIYIQGMTGQQRKMWVMIRNENIKKRRNKMRDEQRAIRKAKQDAAKKEAATKKAALLAARAAAKNPTVPAQAQAITQTPTPAIAQVQASAVAQVPALPK